MKEAIKFLIGVGAASVIILGGFAALDKTHKPPLPPIQTVQPDGMTHDSGGVTKDGQCCDPPALINRPAPTNYDPPTGQVTPEAVWSTPTPQTFTAPQYIPPPTPPQNTQPAPITQPQTHMITLEIISPINGKGLGREYLSRPEPLDEANYIELGVIVRDETGAVRNDLDVFVEATDAEQNKELNGTGDMTNIYVNGDKRTVHYYHFSYQFKTPGEHTITFTCENQTKTVTLQVAEDERP